MKVGYHTRAGVVWVDHPGDPPCLYCGEPVTEASMDGPGVCAWCDMGVNRDGSRWTMQNYHDRMRAGRDRFAAWTVGLP